MKKTSKTKYTVLGMLAIRPMSGYEIQNMIKKTTTNFWSESPGQIYPNLAKLLKEGAIICQEEAYNGKRKSKIYSLTSKGEKILKNWLSTANTTPSPSRDELLLKLFFGKNMTDEQCQKLILQRQHQLEENIEHLNSIKTHLETEHKNQNDSKYWLMTIEHGLYVLHAKLEWCANMLNNLKKIKTGE